MSSLIEISKLHKKFKDKMVLNSVNLSIKKGQSFVIIGSSGSGKTVIMKSILGLLSPDGGSIKINNIETVGLTQRQREHANINLGMLFQNGALFDSLSVWENIAFLAKKKHHLTHKQARNLAAETSLLVGLDTKYLDDDPSTFSVSTHKRIGLARAIATKPKILCFDEPTTGLDPIMTDVINHLIRDCVKKLGATTLTITHDMSSVKIIADYIALLHQGEIIWTGTQKEMNTSDNPYVHQFINGHIHGPFTTSHEA